jgi:hypothetical protein
MPVYPGAPKPQVKGNLGCVQGDHAHSDHDPPFY